VTARTDLTAHGTEQPENAADHREDNAKNPQDGDVQQSSDEEQNDAKGDHDNHVLSP
jgi:hypothetical protein